MLHCTIIGDNSRLPSRIYLHLNVLSKLTISSLPFTHPSTSRPHQHVRFYFRLWCFINLHYYYYYYISCHCWRVLLTTASSNSFLHWNQTVINSAHESTPSPPFHQLFHIQGCLFLFVWLPATSWTIQYVMNCVFNAFYLLVVFVYLSPWHTYEKLARETCTCVIATCRKIFLASNRACSILCKFLVWVSRASLICLNVCTACNVYIF